MKRLAILGTGAIGGMLGAYLAKAGYDVTMISAFRPETARLLNQNGISIQGPKGNFHVEVSASYLGDLSPSDAFDVIFCALKSNDLLTVIPKIKAFLRSDGCLVTLGNGINEELITPMLGTERVIAGISFAGGQQQDACHFTDHDGSFAIGELDGAITPRALEICDILKAARPSVVSQQIRSLQWQKLGTVSVHVPCCTLAGVGMQEAFTHPILMKIFPLLAEEVFAVAAADGCPQETVLGRTREMWMRGDGTPMPTMPATAEKADGLPPKIVDAYTRDIQRGAALEIDYTNGAVVRIGKQYGVTTPVNEDLIHTLREIEAGRAAPGDALCMEFLKRHQPKEEV